MAGRAGLEASHHAMMNVAREAQEIAERAADQTSREAAARGTQHLVHQAIARAAESAARVAVQEATQKSASRPAVARFSSQIQTAIMQAATESALRATQEAARAHPTGAVYEGPPIILPGPKFPNPFGSH
jgi:hypothetical protein